MPRCAYSRCWAKLRIPARRPGYLCRILRKFCDYGYATVQPSAHDRRSRDFALTVWGRDIVQELERFHRERAEALLESLPRHEQRRLVHAMEVIETVLTRNAKENVLEELRVRCLRRRQRRSRASPA